MKDSGFYKISLPLERNRFKELSKSVEFVNTGKGRLGNHLVCMENNRVPIVRTTTNYNIPAHDFAPIHHTLIKEINDNNLVDLPQLHFNNALIEIYESRYKKMKYHSDQSLDLETDSYIGLFSCYERPKELSAQTIRKLKVKDKKTDEEFEILLTHNSVILFSFSTNTKFSHKIVLEDVPKKKQLNSDNKWLGITFRKSKTFIQFRENLPYFSDGKLLELADENQKTEFFKLRGQENKDMNFTYPGLTYTINVADTLLPKSSD